MFCENCGNKLNSNDKFCPKCGSLNKNIVNIDNNIKTKIKNKAYLIRGIVFLALSILIPFILFGLSYIFGIIMYIFLLILSFGLIGIDPNSFSKVVNTSTVSIYNTYSIIVSIILLLIAIIFFFIYFLKKKELRNRK